MRIGANHLQVPVMSTVRSNECVQEMPEVSKSDWPNNYEYFETTCYER
jgi:hypothetical protein